jgi:hypothetical protein
MPRTATTAGHDDLIAVRGAADVLLVGEHNPYDQDPRYALYPLPARSAGGRLCRLVFRMEPKQYLRTFARTNLCRGRWTNRDAGNRAADIARGEWRVVVLLGARVCRAFGHDFRPFTWVAKPATVILPHPSGLSRAWNDPQAFIQARRTLRDAGVVWTERQELS